jgi:hypothetical protein
MGCHARGGDGLGGSVRCRAGILKFYAARTRIYAFCMMLSAMEVALAKRARRREEETIWL